MRIWRKVWNSNSIPEQLVIASLTATSAGTYHNAYAIHRQPLAQANNYRIRKISFAALLLLGSMKHPIFYRLSQAAIQFHVFARAPERIPELAFSPVLAARGSAFARLPAVQRLHQHIQRGNDKSSYWLCCSGNFGVR